MNETKDLVKWVVNLKYSDLPDSVIDFTKRFILDDIGCMLGGALQLGNKCVLKDVISLGANPESTIAVYGHRTTVPNTALVNGSFIAGWDHDSSASGGGHMGSCTAALLPMAERELVDGKAMIAAECAGIEVKCRIGDAGGHGNHHKYPWHSNTNLGPFSAVVVAGKLLGFDEETMENAIAIATGTLGGNYQHYWQWGSSMKRVRCGIGAWAGVRAALLAKEGITGPSEVLEGEQGYLEANSGWSSDGSPYYNASRLNQNLGEKWFTLTYRSKGGACICVSALGSPIETILDMKKKHGFKHEDVESVKIEFVNLMSLRECNWILGTELGRTPAQRLGGSGWSARWMVAEAVVVGKPTIRAQLNNIRPYGRYREIEEMSKKITCSLNTEYYKDLEYYPPQAGRVIVKLKNGEILDGQPLPYRGLNDRVENLHTMESLGLKLRGQASPAGISKVKQDRIIEFVKNLEEQSSISSLIPNLIR